MPSRPTSSTRLEHRRAGLEKRLRRIDESALGHVGSAADIADACMFLAGDEAAFITGQTVGVNGGAYMG